MKTEFSQYEINKKTCNNCQCQSCQSITCPIKCKTFIPCDTPVTKCNEFLDKQ